VAPLLKRWQAGLLLGLVFLVHLVVTALWLSADLLDVYWFPDDFAHVTGLQQLLTSLTLGGPGAAFFYLREINSHYSMLAHYPLALSALAFEPVALAARLANGLYFILLLKGVFELGRLCHSRGAGVLAALLVSLMPAAYGGWRTVGLDFPALCLTPLAVATLLRGGAFGQPGRTILFGAVAALAVLAKPQSLLFFGGPAMIVLLRSLSRQLRDRHRGELYRTLAMAALSTAVILSLTSLWWWGRAGELWSTMISHVTGQGMHHYEGDISLLGGLRYYVESFPLLVSGVLGLALIPCVPLFWRVSRHRWEILAWLVLPVALHVLLKVRHYRYLFPLVPAVAVILAVGLYSLRPRLRWICTGLVTGAAVILWLGCSSAAELCPRLSSHPFAALSRLTSEGTGFWRLLRCGDVKLVGVKCRNSVNQRAIKTGGRMARWIAQRSPGGGEAILYYPLDQTAFALAIQRELPSLKLSQYAWGENRHYRPPPGWKRYVLLRYEDRAPALPHNHLYQERIPAGEHRQGEDVLLLVRFNQQNLRALQDPDLFRLAQAWKRTD